MAKGGKYLRKKPVTKKKGTKVLAIVLIVFAVLVVGGIGFFAWYANSLMNLVSRPDAQVATVPEDLPMETLPTAATITVEGQVIEETTPEDTWPVIVSDKNITNILVVGQAARDGEEQLIADTMILFSINRETKTITMTSFMRDLRLVWPEFIDKDGKSHTGNNRINMAYNMGSRWRGDSTGGMDLLSSIIEYNFGVPVDHAVEVDFTLFEEAINILGGVYVEIDEAELEYLQSNYGYMEDLTVGYTHLDGYQALCYARMRKVGHGDYERTERQREVITSLLNRVKKLNILEIYNLFKNILPMITTDMTNQEITNYALEFIPMLKDLKIQSQRIPFDGNEQSIVRETDGVTDYMIAPGDLKKTAQQLQESIGMTAAEAVN